MNDYLMICVARKPIWCGLVINSVATSMRKGWGWYNRKGHSPSANATLPSAWGPQHINSTSSCRRSVLNPTWTGHKHTFMPKYGCGYHTPPVHVGGEVLIPTRKGPPTYIYAQIRVCLSHTSCPCGWYSTPHKRGPQHTFTPKYSCAPHANTIPVHVGGPNT